MEKKHSKAEALELESRRGMRAKILRWTKDSECEIHLQKRCKDRLPLPR